MSGTFSPHDTEHDSDNVWQATKTTMATLCHSATVNSAPPQQGSQALKLMQSLSQYSEKDFC
jgi:hypothetical protein